MNRQEINRIILKKLSAINECTPNIRFGQLLAIAKVITYKEPTDLDIRSAKAPEVIDPFYEESSVTLKRVESNK